MVFADRRSHYFHQRNLPIGTRMLTKQVAELPDVKPCEWEALFSNLMCQCEE